MAQPRRLHPLYDQTAWLQRVGCGNPTLSRNDDPKQVQQKTLPFVVLNKLAKSQVTELDRAVAQLTISTAFFACHSCKYLKFPRREMKRTKLFCLRNIRFFKDGQLLPALSDNLEFANSIAVPFEMQKNDKKHETIIHGQTDNPVLCPDKSWTQLVNRILTYLGTTVKTSVCAVWRHNRCNQITLHQAIMTLWSACATMAEHTSALSPVKLAHTPYARVPQWKCTKQGYQCTPSCSSADGWVTPFLHYIWKQVEQSLQDDTKKMSTHWLFWTGVSFSRSLKKSGEGRIE